QDYGEVLYLLGLDQRQCFEHLIESPKTAGHDDEGVGVFDQHDFANEEVIELQHFVEVWVWLLLEWQLDVAADGSSAGFLCAAVSRFHKAGAAARHDGEAGLYQRLSRVSSERIIGMVFLKSRRSEDRYAGAHKMQRPEAADKLPEDLDGKL